MKKADFVQSEVVKGFIDWALVSLPMLKVNLDVSKKGTGTFGGKSGPGVKGTFVGLNQVTTAYHWRGGWLDGSDVKHESSDWLSTRDSLKSLGDWLKSEIESEDDGRILKCCENILKWGGDRNPNVGARQFLKDQRNLTKYLKTAQGQLKLSNADTDDCYAIQEMNSMLTKVHSLASTDGLPIYDSRVAAAIACLVEIYRQQLEKPWHAKNFPETLRFKARDYTQKRRRVLGLVDNADQVVDPGVITSGRGVSAWVSAKIRLGWLIEQIITRSESEMRPIFTSETVDESFVSKMHAFEAALFMIGFDVSCLKESFTGSRNEA